MHAQNGRSDELGVTFMRQPANSIRPSAKNRAASQFVRLDGIRHPYGPCPAALEAMQHPPLGGQETLALRLRARLAELYRVPTDSIRFLGTRQRTLKQLVGSIEGPLISFPPSSITSQVEQLWPHREQQWIQRGVGKFAALSYERVMDLPGNSVAVIDSPSDVLGTLLGAADAVRLARACQFLIVDERCAEFSGRSLLSMALEFENVAIIRTFDVWAGLSDAPFAWTLASPRSNLASQLTQELPAIEITAAALATLDDLPNVSATLRMLREERSRLYRELRKLLLFEPLPSWGPFVTARLTMGRREDVVNELRCHGIAVHAPRHPGLERYIRFGIGSWSEMDHLRQALHVMAPKFLA